MISENQTSEKFQMNKMKILCLNIALIVLIGCKSESEICGELYGVHYLVNHYYTNMKKIDHTEYYNNQDQILRWWKPAEEIKNYKYDKEGRLIEIQYSRTCQSVIKYEYKIYDDNGKLIGEQTSRHPIETVNSIRTKFYNNLGQLELENSEKGGKQFQTKYSYENDRLVKMFTVNTEQEIIESETYFYANSNLVDSTLVFRNGITTIETNKYDNQNRLIHKTIKNKTKFDNYNHERTYEYKDKGTIRIERRLNKDGESHLTIITEKKYAT